MTLQLEFRFERGSTLTAELLLDKAPKTIEAVLASLPLQAMVYHSRWSGREINFPLQAKLPVPRENETTQTNIGDVIYWKEWEKEEGAAEAIAIYYGAELTRDHRGLLPVNIFARIPPSQWLLIEEIGIRIWQQGGEQVEVRATE